MVIFLGDTVVALAIVVVYVTWGICWLPVGENMFSVDVLLLRLRI